MICFYIKNINIKNNNKREINNDRIINYLNKTMTGLIFLNLSIIKFNILSPVELEIFVDKNVKIINIIYLILSFYVIGYVITNSLFLLKRVTKMS